MKPDPTRPFLRAPDHPIWNAQHNHVRQMLGLPKKLPREGVPPQVIQGIKVWVNPAGPRIMVDKWGKERVLKSSTHRVMAECPLCGKHMSAGRLHQHKCQSSTSKETV